MQQEAALNTLKTTEKKKYTRICKVYLNVMCYIQIHHLREGKKEKWIIKVTKKGQLINNSTTEKNTHGNHNHQVLQPDEKKKKNICTVLLQVERQSLNTWKLWLSGGIFDNGQGIGVQNSCQPPTFLGPNLGTSMTCPLNAPWNGLSHIDCMYRVLYKWDWPGVHNCSCLNCCLCCDQIWHTGGVYSLMPGLVD